MDRLSAYAAREAESELPEDRKQTEEEATSKLLEKLRISKEKRPPETNGDSAQVSETKTDGDKPPATEPPNIQVNGNSPEPTEPDSQPKSDESPPPTKSRGIPEDVKLYEIFYDQVVNLVNAQRLHIQDTIALLVSLSNLAL